MYYRIGEFSKMSKATVKTLRYYDDIGLFKPAFIDNENGYRYYTAAQLEDISRILFLRETDMPIDDVQSVLAGENELSVLKKRLAVLENELNDKQRQIGLVKKYIKGSKKKMNYQAVIKKLPECTVFFRHGIIPDLNGIPNFIMDAHAEFEANNPNIRYAEDKGGCWISYMAEGFQEADIELEYCQTIDKMGKNSQNIGCKVFKETLAVSVQVKGAYTNLSAGYAYAINYVDENGFKISGPIREKYICGAWNKDNEEDYLTEIQIPVVDAKARKEEYKNRTVYGGVYGIKNKVTGKVLVCSAVDMHGSREKFDFAVSINSSTMYLKIQEDWKKYGPNAFEYIEYELVKKEGDDFAEWIDELEKEWRARLGDNAVK